MGGSIFVRQYPKRLEIVSPGGFPPGITAENLLWKQAPRNRRVAEVMGRCDLVERSGQGADLMFSTCIRESKALPDFSASDDYEVSLVLSGEVQDEQFLRFLERVGAETLASFNSGDFLLLDAIHRELPVPNRLRGRLPKLLELGIIERLAHGRSYLLSQRFYQLAGRSGAYTRRKGLDKETNKELLLKHIKRNKAKEAPSEICRRCCRRVRSDKSATCLPRRRMRDWCIRVDEREPHAGIQARSQPGTVIGISRYDTLLVNQRLMNEYFIDVNSYLPCI